MADIGHVRVARIHVCRAVTALATLVWFELAAVGIPSAKAQTFSVLHSFTDSPDGANPFGGLIRDASGNLYGTTFGGGCTPYACGTVFMVEAAGNETVLYNFGRANPAYVPAHPYAPLLRDAAGNLYGTTRDGGSTGNGTVFKIDTAGNLFVVHSFAGTDGANPIGGLVRDAAGNLYGTTQAGGTASGPPACGFGYCGTVFKLDPAGSLTVLHTFTSGDGASPTAGLVMDAAGNLYGTTGGGGTGLCIRDASNVGCGIVFKIDAIGNFSVLHNFTDSPDGANPFGPLIMDAAGNLYGTTSAGGTGRCVVYGFGPPNGGCGTIFKLDLSGRETVLYSFTGGAAPGTSGNDGAAPYYGGLMMDAAGNLYGTTAVGGSGPCTGGPSAAGSVLVGCGTVFRLDSSGHETVLHSFTGGSDGAFPYGGLAMDTAGNLYGTASSFLALGGYGTVFKLTLQTPAPTIATISPTNATAGGAAFTLTVNGTNFVSGSTVSFDGNARTTTFVSATQLTAAVLASDIATAGSFNVKVTNPAGAGTSNAVSFTVNNPAPTITSISPTSTIVGSSDFTLTVNGTNFVSGSTVSFNGNARATTFVSATQLTAAILATDIAVAGSFNVKVVSPAPGGGTSNAVSFTVQTPQQAIQTIINAVNVLFSFGTLNRGQDNSLVRQLQQAINLMNAGKNAGAMDNLNSFISAVNDLLRSGVLSSSQAAPLINAARTVIARLS